MAQTSFYHLTRVNLEKSLPRLLEKILHQGLRAVVVAQTEAQVQNLDEILWTYSPPSFLPHGTSRDENPQDHPIWITSQIENPNASTVLVLTYPHLLEENSLFERVAYIFDGNDEEVLKKSRALWERYKAREYALAYWQQDVEGRWVQKEV